MKKKILISTGGSGGHVIPAKILIDHLSYNFEVIISTDQRGEKFLNDVSNKKIKINTQKLNNFYLFPLNLIKILILTFKSFFILKNNQINILISTGGYMSLPLCLAAKILSIKIFLLEPNMILGRANNFFLKFSEKIFCYTHSIKNFPSKFLDKIVLIEPLVRFMFYEKLNDYIKKDKFNFLVIGGSQGANIFDFEINESFYEISKSFSIKVTHQTSEQNIEKLKDFYLKRNIDCHVFSYDSNFFNLINQIDFCITRGGASTLAELSLMNIPFLVVPLPTAKDNHQYENALYYKKNNSCWIIDQTNFNKKELSQFFLNILANNNDYLKKKENLKKLNYQNSWNNVNQKILDTLNAN